VRYLTITALTATLSFSPVFAANQSTNPPAQTTLSVNRSQKERISFLLDAAQSYINEEDYASAISAYERILTIDPNHEEAGYTLAHIYIYAKQYKKAESALKKLIETKPEDFQLWNNLAWIYATAEEPSMRNAEKAIAYAQEALTLAPNDYHVWSTLSEAYYVAGEYEKAYRAITHMATLVARYGKGISKESVESYNEQIRKCKRALDTIKTLEMDENSE